MHLPNRMLCQSTFLECSRPFTIPAICLGSYAKAGKTKHHGQKCVTNTLTGPFILYRVPQELNFLFDLPLYFTLVTLSWEGVNKKYLGGIFPEDFS